jgi:hypothetical protein
MRRRFSGGEHQNLIILHFHYTAIDVHHFLLLVTRHDAHISCSKCCNHFGMAGKDLKGAFSSGELHQGGFAVKKLFFGADDGQMHISCGLSGVFSQYFLSFFDGFIDGTYEVEGGFGILIHLAIHDHIEPFDGIFDVHHTTFDPGELFGYVERL